jgi:hypothetical protein
LGITLHGDLQETIVEGASKPRKRKVGMKQVCFGSAANGSRLGKWRDRGPGEELGVPAPPNRALWQRMTGIE